MAIFYTILSILGTLALVMVFDKILLDTLLSPYKEAIEPTLAKVQVDLSYKVWFAGLVVFIGIIGELFRRLKQKENEVKTIKGELEESKTEIQNLTKTVEELKGYKMVSSLKTGTKDNPGPSELFEINKNYVNRLSEVTAVQLYQYTVKTDLTKRTYEFTVLESHCYLKPGESISHRSDKVEITKYLYDKLVRCSANGTLATLIEELTVQLRGSSSDKQSVAYLTLLNVAFTIMAFQAGIELQNNYTPSLNDPKKEQYIKGLKRTGIVEGIIFNEILKGTTKYNFIKTQGTLEKIGRWYSAIKRNDQDKLFLITFEKNIKKEKLDELSKQYTDTLKKSHLL